MNTPKKAVPPVYVTLPTATDEMDETGQYKPSEDSVNLLREFGQENQK